MICEVWNFLMFCFWASVVLLFGGVLAFAVLCICFFPLVVACWTAVKIVALIVGGVA